MHDPSKPLVSIIIPVKNEGAHIQNTLRSAFAAKTDYPFEIIVVDDGSTDGCCSFLAGAGGRQRVKLITTKGVGLANAKNLGAANAAGTYFIFCDAHLFFEDYWQDKLLQPMLEGIASGVSPGIADTRSPETTGYGQTLNAHLGVEWHLNKTELFPVAVMPGGCCAVSRQAFGMVGGFDCGFQVWGYEDVEFSLRMWLFGYICCIQPSVKILHVFRSATPYPNSLYNVYYNMLRMCYSHFGEERIERCRSLIRQPYHTEQIERAVLKGGALDQRGRCFSSRLFDDDWFMNQFGIPF